MNKKKLLVTLLVGVMALAVVNAILVTYLSNTITASVPVESPMELRISLSDDSGWAETLELDTMYTGGADTFTFYTREKNIADESVTGYIKNVVESPGITCGDFESIMVSTKTDEGDYGTPVEMIGYCDKVNSYTVKFDYPYQPLTWDAGQVDVNMITVTFEDVVGEYTFTSRVVPTA